MHQRHYANPTPDYDGRWTGPNGDFLVEVMRTSNARDLRGALLALAYALEREPTSTLALLVITESKLSPARLREELVRFRSIVHERVGVKLHLASYTSDLSALQTALPLDNRALALFVHQLVLHEIATNGGRVSRVFVQSLVIERWLQGRSFASVSEVQADSRASKPTVMAAIERIRELGVLDSSSGRVAVRQPTWEAWRQLAQDLRSERKTIYLDDPSGLVRQPNELLARLHSILDRVKSHFDVAVGGVLGASCIHPMLNITAPPRLDLCVYDGNTAFLRKLDAGLVEVKNEKGNAPLALHLGRRLKSTPPLQMHGLDQASPLECLADLLDIGLQAEAREFADHLNSINAVEADGA